MKINSWPNEKWNICWNKHPNIQTLCMWISNVYCPMLTNHNLDLVLIFSLPHQFICQIIIKTNNHGPNKSKQTDPTIQTSLRYVLFTFSCFLIFCVFSHILNLSTTQFNNIRLGIWRSGNASDFGSEDRRFDPYYARLFMKRIMNKQIKIRKEKNKIK